MVHLVIVAHSLRLAEGVKELADQMVQGAVPIAIAAGTGDPQHPIGTNVEDVVKAIESVYSDDGVVIFMDLGSAILSAEMALDMLPPERRRRIFLSDAPLVEGVLAAAVQAAAGQPVETVLAEARAALTAKSAQLGQAPPQAIAPEEAEAPAERGALPTRSVRLTVRNPLGLHARPAARFVTTAARFASNITVQNLTRGTQAVNAKSINQVATLGVQQGHEILVTAEGPDAEEAVVALAHLVEHELVEEAPPPPPVLEGPPSATPEEAHPTGHLKGIPASQGIAVGSAYLYHPAAPEVPRRHAEDPEAEWQRLQQAIRTAKEEIQALRTRAARQAGEAEAAIFDAHLLMLEDPTLLDLARKHLFEEGLSAEAAWKEAVDHIAAEYRSLENPYQQARAADVADVGQRVLRLLTGVTVHPLRLEKPAVLIAADLTPSDTAQLDPEQVLGICTAVGGPTSHSAILARALGIPAVVGVGPAILRVPEGAEVALDGSTGDVWVEPDEELKQKLSKAHARWQAQQQAEQAAAHLEAVTTDGHRVAVVANIRGLADARLAVEHGAEGVGLLRTEFLFLERLSPPSEEEQVEVYQAIAEALGTRPLVVRTFDIGGDKPVPYISREPEANPFLGLRGIRLALARPELLKTQLRALLRAGHGHHIKIMFPMVAERRELLEARAILQEAREELEREGRPFAPEVEVGIMVEVPAAAELADALAPEVDFFSIGTNDLSQYAMAADRTNPRVAPLADALHPAILRLIHHTVEAARQAGIWVGVCGEVAGDPLAVPLLVGLGVDELSVNPPAVPAVKNTVRRLSLQSAQKLAAEALEMDSAQAVRDHVAAALQP